MGTTAIATCRAMNLGINSEARTPLNRSAHLEVVSTRENSYLTRKSSLETGASWLFLHEYRRRSLDQEPPVNT